MSIKPTSTATVGFFESATFWAGLTGVIVGGLISFVIQLYVIKKSRDAVQEERDIKRQALASSLIFRLMRMMSDVKNSQNYLEEILDKAEQDKVQPWQVFRPIAFKFNRVKIPPEEAGVVLQLEDRTQINEVLEAELSHENIVETFNALNERVDELKRNLSIHLDDSSTNDDPTAYVSRLTKDDMERLLPRMQEINGLTSELRALASDVYERIRTATRKLGGDFTAEFGIKLEIEEKAQKHE